MAPHSLVLAFDHSKEVWSRYTDRIKHYFIANDVTNNRKKRSILVSVCGAITFKLVRTFVGEDKLDSTSYDKIVKQVQSHYDPKLSAIIQRYNFNNGQEQKVNQ